MRYGYRTFNIILLLFLATNCFAAQDVIEAPEKDESIAVESINEEVRKLYTEIDQQVDALDTRLDVLEAASTGKIIQVVNLQTATVDSDANGQIPQDNSVPQLNEGNTYMSLAITPTSASNKLRIDIVFKGATNKTNSGIIVALFNTDTHATNALNTASCQGDTSDTMQTIAFSHWMTAPVTTAMTFVVQGGIGEGTGTLTFNGEGGANIFGATEHSSVTISEIEP